MTIGEFVDKFGELRSQQILVIHRDSSAIAEVDIHDVQMLVDRFGVASVVISPNDPYVS
jgi:hypothetical protein